ncbi:hypothetical protein JCM5353_006100 [Sporobolomyces roseus]
MDHIVRPSTRFDSNYNPRSSSPSTPSSSSSARPQLSLSTSSTVSNQPLSPPNNTASSTDTIKGGQSQWERGGKGQDVTQLPSQRAHSHTRSYSMNEHQYSTASGSAAGGGGIDGGFSSSGYPKFDSNSSSAGSNMGDSVISGVTTVSGGANGGAGLTRRNNTVGASNSRLVRLERNRARIALQGAGLSEEDQEFYVPPSPARTGPYANVPWSDVGHGSSDFDSTFPSLVSPTGSTFDRHSRSFSNQSDVVAAAAWARAGPPQTSQAPGGMNQAQTNVPEPKRSSFVVLRGGKGDSKLTERRPATATSPPPASSSFYNDDDSTHQSESQAVDIEGTGDGSTTPLRHKNSLKPFLDQEREEREQRGRAEEDWERGLMDERKSGAEGGAEGELDDGDHAWLQNDPYATLKTPPLSSSFPNQLSSPFGSTHSRSSTFHAPARGQTDPWSSSSSTSNGFNITAAAEEEASIRRHQSLSSFRHREPTDPNQPLSTSPGSSYLNDEPAHLERAHSLTIAASRPLGSLALNSTSTIAGFGSRSRSGTSPAPLTLHHSQSLGHATSSQRAGLSHSNSLGSRKSSSSGGTAGGGGGGGSLSPSLSGAVSGLKSPWSPTEEETKQLGMGTIGSGGAVSPNGTGSLSRGGSGSSRGSQTAGVGSSVVDEQVGRLGDQLGGMQMNYVERATPSPSLQQQYISSPSRVPPPPQSALPPPSNSSRRLAPLVTNTEGFSPNTQQAFLSRQGPASAAAFVPPIGHSHQPFARGSNFGNGMMGMGEISEHPSSNFTDPNQQNVYPSNSSSNNQTPLAHPVQLPPPQPIYANSMQPPPVSNSLPPSSFPSQLHPQHASAFPGGPSSTEWSRQKDFLMGGNPNSGPMSASTLVPPASLPFSATINPPLPPQGSVPPADWNLMQQQQAQISLLQSQMAQALRAMDEITAKNGSSHQTNSTGNRTVEKERAEEVAETPIDVNSLIQKKGYNPTMFDLRPQNARFFVIKSYTEEDVHKSLKYEIWASTDLGNKRLDKAFRESADKGPIYLFFSVNASGHFAGMAQMLTPVDYSLTSNVWASDKWKGVLKVRWIYIKDVPLNALRHIRLNNTPENKPVTSSRDTQEVPYDAGLEVLRIIATYQSRASLLQDFAWYEAQHRLDKSNEEAGASVVGDSTVPPRQAHYARNDRNQPQQPPSNSGTPPPPAPSSSNQQSQTYNPHERQHSQNSQAYPQFVPPTPPYSQLPSHGFSPSPPPLHPHQSQQQPGQRQPFRSFWSRGGNGNSPQQFPNGGPQNQNQQQYSMNNGQFDGSGLAF